MLSHFLAFKTAATKRIAERAKIEVKEYSISLEPNGKNLVKTCQTMNETSMRMALVLVFNLFNFDHNIRDMVFSCVLGFLFRVQFTVHAHATIS